MGLVLDAPCQQQRHRTSEGDGTKPGRFQPDEGGLEGLTRRTAIDSDVLGSQGSTIVHSQRLQRISEFTGLGVEKGLHLEYGRPIVVQGLDALQADSRLAHVAGRKAGHRLAAGLSDGMTTGAPTVGRQWRTRRIVYDTDSDIAPQSARLPWY